MLDGTDADLWPVTLHGVRLTRGGRALLDGLSLTLAPGGVTALIGPNGAGKSLTLRLIAGLIAPDAGTLRWGAARAPGRGAVALVFQKPVLLRRSAGANIDHALAVAGVSRRERPARRAALLALAGLEALAGEPARALSGGEAQRLALARALAARPRLLLLDEPTASLDPAATAAIEALIGRVAAQGTTVLLVTHDAGQVRRLADRALFLHAGRVTEDAPAARLLSDPQSPQAQAYLAGRLLL
ncbi:MAG: ATP-binding cassette domain-containing protein [Alphaproteobacteria bacterium]|nr:ATP-binding cassette domain-containing protein [Alphaproteobacteria bacterium]